MDRKVYRTVHVDLEAYPLVNTDVKGSFYLILQEDELDEYLLLFKTRIHPIVITNVAPGSERSIYLEKNAVVCNSEDELNLYINSVNTSFTGKRYRIIGFKGMCNFWFHFYMKGAIFSPLFETNIYLLKVDDRPSTFTIDVNKMYSLEAEYKSILDKKSALYFLAKDKLQTMNTRAFSFVPRSYNTVNFSLIQDKKYILKALGKGASGGKGVYSFSTSSEYQDSLKKLKEDGFPRGVVSDYIWNPMLFRKKKFHLRVYLFVASNGYYSLFNIAKIITAKKEYVDTDYSNKNIHDTHLKSTDENYYFPDDLSSARMWNDVKKICRVLGEHRIKAYPECRYGYDVLGLDILPDETGKCWLLEANFSPGMDPVIYDEKHYAFEKKYFKWYTDSILSVRR